MSEDIRVGDRFLVECEVTYVGTPHGDCSVSFVGTSDDYDADLPTEFLLASKRLPRAIKVGDKVQYGGMKLTVTAIRGGHTWCHEIDAAADSDGFRIPLSLLEPSP